MILASQAGLRLPANPATSMQPQQDSFVNPFIIDPKQEMGLFQTIGDVVDRPGNAFRGLLSGNLGGMKGLIPFAETMGIFDDDDRTSGQQLLFGRDSEPAPLLSGKGAAGLAAEIILDPLNLLPGFMGLKAATKGGKAAKQIAMQMTRAEKAADAQRAAMTAMTKIDGVKNHDLFGAFSQKDKLIKALEETTEINKLFGFEAIDTYGKMLSKDEIFDTLKQTDRTTDISNTARTAGGNREFLPKAADRVRAGQEDFFSVGGGFEPLPLMGPLFDLPQVPLIGGELGAKGAQLFQDIGQALPHLPGIRNIGKAFKQSDVEKAATRGRGAQEAALASEAELLGRAEELSNLGKIDEAAELMSPGITKRQPSKNIDNLTKDPFNHVASGEAGIEATAARPNSVPDLARTDAATKLNSVGMDPKTAVEEANKLFEDGISDGGIEATNKMLSNLIEGSGIVPEKAVNLVNAFKERYKIIAQFETEYTGLKPIKGNYAPHITTGDGKDFFMGLAKEGGDRQKAFVADLNATLKERGMAPLQITKKSQKPSVGGRFAWAMDHFGLTDEFLETASHGSMKGRKYSGLTIADLNEAAGRHGAAKEVFDTNPFNGLYRREMRFSRTKGAVDYIDGLTGVGLARKVKEGEVVLGPQVSSGVQSAKTLVGEDGFISTLIPAKNGKHTIFDTEDAAQRAGKAFNLMSGDEATEGFFAAYDQVTRLFKSSLTRAFPAFHIRNRFSNRIQGNFVGVPVMGEHYKLGNRLVAGKKVQMKLPNGELVDEKFILNEMRENGILSNGHFESLAGEIGQEAIQNKQKLNFNPLDPNNAFIRGGEKISSTMANSPSTILSGGNLKDLGKIDGRVLENVDRAGVYLYKRFTEGLPPANAADAVNQSMFDYSKAAKTPFEQNVMDRAMLFYSYQRNVIPFMIERAMTNSKKMVPWLRLANQPTKADHTPAWIREGLSIPLSEDKAGNQQFLRGLGTPMEAAVEPFAGFQEGIGRGIGKLATGLVPQLKAPIELMTGKDLFLSKDIKDLKKAPHSFRLLPDVVKDSLGIRDIRKKDGTRIRTEMDPWAAWFLRNTPVARFSNTLSKATDDRKDFAETATNLFTGLNVVSVDPKRSKAYAERNAIVDKLRELEGTGAAFELRNMFVGRDKESKKQIKLLKDELKRVGNKIKQNTK